MLVDYDRLGLLFLSLAFNIWWFGKLKSFMMFPCAWVSFVPYFTVFSSLYAINIVCVPFTFVPFCSIFSVISILYAILIMVRCGLLCAVWLRKLKIYILPIVYVSMTPWLKASTQQIGHKMPYRLHIQMVANLHKCFCGPLKFCVFLMMSFLRDIIFSNSRARWFRINLPLFQRAEFTKHMGIHIMTWGLLCGWTTKDENCHGHGKGLPNCF